MKAIPSAEHVRAREPLTWPDEYADGNVYEFTTEEVQANGRTLEQVRKDLHNYARTRSLRAITRMIGPKSTRKLRFRFVKRP